MFAVFGTNNNGKLSCLINMLRNLIQYREGIRTKTFCHTLAQIIQLKHPDLNEDTKKCIYLWFRWVNK